jgi:type IV pilus assembly protein PilM
MKNLFFKDKPISGLDIGQTGAKIMAIDTKKWQVLGYGSRDMTPVKLHESIDKGTDYLANEITEMLKSNLNGHLPSNHVIVSAPTGRTYSRTITLPSSAEANLAEAIQLEAEQYIPIASSELNIDHEIVERTGDNITVLMSAVPKKIVDATVAACNKAGLEVIMVEPGLSAICRLIAVTEEGHLPTVIVDIGAANTDIAIFDETIRVTGGVPIGGNSFTLEISKVLKVSLEQAHQLKVISGLRPGPKQEVLVKTLSPTISRLVAEINKIIRYYTERLGSDKKVEQIVIVGGGSNMPGLGDYFTNEMMMPARVASPWQRLDFGTLPQPTRQFKPRFITAAGLATIDPVEIWEGN